MPRQRSPPHDFEDSSSKRRKASDRDRSPVERSRSHREDRDYSSSSRKDRDRDRDRDRVRDRDRDRENTRDRDTDRDDRHRRRDKDSDRDRHRGRDDERDRRYRSDDRRDRDSPRSHHPSRVDDLKPSAASSLRDGSVSSPVPRLPLNNEAFTATPPVTNTSSLSRAPEPTFAPKLTNGHLVATSSEASAPRTGPANETPEEEKLRLKRERLEAWKKKKAAADSGQGAATPDQQSTPTVSAPPTSKTNPAAAAANAAASIASRLGLPLNNAGSSRLAPGVKGLPAKPTFNAFAASSAAHKRKVGVGMDDEEKGKKLEKLQFAPLSEAEKQAAVVEGDESDDEELVDREERGPEARDVKEGEVVEVDEAEEKEREEKARQRAEWAKARAAEVGIEVADTSAEASDAMDVDGESKPSEDVKEPESAAQPAPEVARPLKKTAKKAPKPPPALMEEDADIDPLDAFMSNVTEEVKKVNAADRVRMGIATDMDEGDDENEGETDRVVEEDELEKTDLRPEDILALAAKKLKKKDLQPVDHSKMKYESFRKAFYHPLPEIEAMTDDEVHVLRTEMDNIRIRGQSCPKPITKWSHCGLPAVCLEVIKPLSYDRPSPIQSQAIPAIMSGRDVIGVAKTGSGKTIAFLLPMFRHIKDQRPLEALEGPIGLVMTPTRELATQIHKECKPFLKALGLRASCAYGGTPLKDNIADMKRGSEIIVCTPGRMIELLTTNSGKIINLRRVTYLVLDEADRMFDMGFEPQVMKIVSQIRPERQTVLFSATFPKQMEGLARKILHNKPLEITVGGRSVVAAEIEQFVEVREESTKFNRLLEILGRTYNEDQDARTLVFVDRQDAADNLYRDLRKKTYLCMSLHGGKDQVDRDQTISDFKAGNVPIVIATSVAARGLDVKQLKLVINYDCPNHMEDYVHRAGRTGRAGNKGTCITFVTPEQDRYALDIVKALTASGANVPDDLKAMSEAFVAKVKEGKAHAAGSGFGGKGLERLEKDRDAKERAERSAYGEVAEEKTEAAVDPDEPTATTTTTTPAMTLPGLDNIEIKKGPAPDPSKKAAPAHAKQVSTPSVSLDPEASAKAKAAAVAASLNAILAQKRQERHAETQHSADPIAAARRRDPDATDYHAEIPINDYPQKARWRVTNKETMVQLIDSSGASITNKGVYYEKGKEPGPDDPPKLHLLIESNDEFRVRQAVTEIKRILLEASAAALEAEARNPGAPSGRYSVL